MTHLLRATLLALSLLAVPAALLPAADAAIDLCDKTDVCVRREGVCASVVWYVAIDFAVGAGNCPGASVGPSGVAACETAWAGMGTLGGFQGVLANACVVQDQSGGLCVTAHGQVGRDPTVLDPLCLA